jgi:hypothetical protein
MRVVIETRHTLVVEDRGRAVPIAGCAAIALHAWLFLTQVRPLVRPHAGLTWFLLLVSLLLYAAVVYLAFGPFRDKITVTFHGVKNLVTVEKYLPLGLSMRDEIAFADFDAFEVSPREKQGFCRLRLKDGTVRRLLRIRTDEDFELMKRLPHITKKEVQLDQ